MTSKKDLEVRFSEAEFPESGDFLIRIVDMLADKVINNIISGFREPGLGIVRLK